MVSQLLQHSARFVINLFTVLKSGGELRGYSGFYGNPESNVETKVIAYLPISFDNGISFLCSIWLCALACKIAELISGLELIHQDKFDLFVLMKSCGDKCEVGSP